MRAFSRIVTFSTAFAVLLSGAASAGEIPFSKELGPNQKISGIVDQDDSSGEMNAAKGTASGAANGEFILGRVDPNAAITGSGVKLEVNFSRREQQLRARLDTCASADSCSEGAWVVLWEKP